MCICVFSISTKDWASMLFQFKTQYGLNIHEAKLPSQSLPRTPANLLSSTQMGMHLDSTLTLQTRKRYISRMRTDPESSRTKYRVMTNLWLLAQLRQPGRQLSADTFNDCLEELLSTDNFLTKREIEGETWAHSMECEFQLRREAMKAVQRRRVQHPSSIMGGVP